MASGKEAGSVGFLSQLFQPSVYKRTQGRWTRQVTAFAVAAAIGIGAWQLSDLLFRYGLAVRVVIPAALFAIGCWIAYRIVNMPRFADFLIAVEAEMSKVSWPSRTELWRASMVVLATIFFLAMILLFYDFFWVKLLGYLGVG